MESKQVHGKVAPRKRGSRKKEGLAFLVFVALAMGMFFVSVIRDNLGLDSREVAFGATFSVPYAESFGLDWKEAYVASMDDLGLRRLRIPAYWNRIEPEPGKYDFTDLDWMLREAGKRDVRVLLAIGRKVPRWPECHAPGWTSELSESEVRLRILAMLETVVKRYADDPAIAAWQVENEPLFDFGECPPPDRDFLKREVALVRSLDDRPVMVTVSGELSTWAPVANVADIVGISTYRTAWNRYVGYFYWPIGPRFYSRRYEAIAPFVDGIIVSELQAEPWVTQAIHTVPYDEQRALMNPSRLRENVEFTRRIGFPEVYLWGIEWWYWAREEGRPEMWDAGKAIIRASADAPGLEY